MNEVIKIKVVDYSAMTSSCKVPIKTTRTKPEAQLTNWHNNPHNRWC